MPLDLIFISPGTYTIDDDGIVGNNTSVIRDGTGAVIFTFAHPVDSLSFTASSPGVNIVVNLSESLGSANFRIGDLTNPAVTPDSIVVKNVRTTGIVTLVSNGTINEGGSDAGADVVAGQLVMSAQSGIGTGGNALETQVGLLEAETVTGGIAIGNFGSVQIGGVSDEVAGLHVETSGNLNFTNVGTILLADDSGPESVHGGATSGDVTMIASGFDADIISTVNNDAVNVPGGNLTLQAGRDIGFGIIGTDFDNDVRARGSVTVTAGRDFLVDGFSDIASDDFGGSTGGNLTITTGRNIHVRNIAGTDGSIAASGSAGADLILTTGAGGAVVLDAPTSGAVGSFSGDVRINADRMLINSASGISANAGAVFIRPVTAGREMLLGSASDAAFALELSDAELDRIFTPTLTLGSDTTGTISVVGDISPASAANVLLRSGEDLRLQAGIAVTNSLGLSAGNDLIHTAGVLSGGTIAAQVDNVGNDGGTGGFGNLGVTTGVTTLTLNGNAEADTLSGTEGIAQTVHGNGGNDRIISSGEGSYFGDDGNDTILGGLSSGIVNEVLDGGSGIDTVDTSSFSGDYIINLATGVTNFGYESFVNFENAVTGNGADTVTGTSGANTITTGAGKDVIDGAGGADTMVGGADDDWYKVDNAGDVVVESLGEGTADRVFASVNYTLGAGVHVELLTTNDNAATTAINLTGNEIANTIFGNAGANILDGKGGADALIGFGGDDWYFVDNAADTVTEAVGGGANDRVFSAVNYTLAVGQQIERLSTADNAATTAINLTGNEIANIVYGNAGANVLDGRGGADSLAGFAGDDWYLVDNAGDIVFESAGQGANDRVFASVSYTLGAGVQVEMLTTNDNLATTAINLTGNELVNVIFGNAGANTLNGAAGADTMVGAAGDDWYFVDNAADSVVEGAGQGANDRVFTSVSYTLGAGVQVEMFTTTDSAGATALNLTGNEFANTIFGNAGVNVLDGKGGSDTLVGLAGVDTFRFTTALGAGNVDAISGYSVADDTIQLENAVFTGLAAGALAAGAFNTGSAATQADDRIIYNSASGALLFDADGNGAGAAIQFAAVNPGLAMTASEFVVI